MTSTLSPATYTVEEYLAQEAQAQERHEYRQGEMIPMPGGTINHNRIALNLAGALNIALKRQPFEVFMADQRLGILAQSMYTYPDVLIIQQPPELQPGREDVVLNAVAIAEILSPSTRSYDKDEKFAAYRRIDCFREYVLIEPATPHVEYYTKTADDAWLFREYDGLDATLTWQSFEFAIALADLYDKVNFATATINLQTPPKSPEA
ncbi:MAG: Uma2 family endonuclease [Spirulinaceae cyanobacterium RM2_2_10]|nr:Uma2 family endonuclease [Spirulinaceae cyanobacterium SM2_1_0]NJO19321.1 Uma2 family endonuclease [Spirulinaceae cyanobacterium RM2_2_10]